MTDPIPALEGALPWQPRTVPAQIPVGDMPGDKVEIGPAHIDKANAIFPMLVGELIPALQANPRARAVVSVAGGSGVGKSEIASLLSYFLRGVGVGAYTVSGDNYPRRIPAQNDAERLRIFRNGGLRGLITDGQYSPSRGEVLRTLQAADDDAAPGLVAEHPWLASYQAAGRRALSGYLGTPAEIDFDHLSTLIGQFKNGADEVLLRRMGRTPSELWYDPVDLSAVSVLAVEWTHGTNANLDGVDVPILLHSTPAETLAHRRSRARDGGTDSPFTSMVLGIEQELLERRAPSARIIVAKNGERLTMSEYRAQLVDQDGAGDE